MHMLISSLMVLSVAAALPRHEPEAATRFRVKPRWMERTMLHQTAALASLAPKLNVVLDIDETLVHSRHDSFLMPNQPAWMAKDRGNISGIHWFTMQMVDGETCVVNKRPGVDEFLRNLCLDPNVVLWIFTAGEPIYAQPIIGQLQTDAKLDKDAPNCLDNSRVLYRYNTTVRGVVDKKHFGDDNKHELFLKDLRKVEPDLKRVVLVDDQPVSGALQPDNWIQIPPFTKNPQDGDALGRVYGVIKQLESAEDVRPVLGAMSHARAQLAPLRRLIKAGQPAKNDKKIAGFLKTPK